MWQVKASITFRDGSKVWAETASVVRAVFYLAGALPGRSSPSPDSEHQPHFVRRRVLGSLA